MHALFEYIVVHGSFDNITLLATSYQLCNHNKVHLKNKIILLITQLRDSLLLPLTPLYIHHNYDLDPKQLCNSATFWILAAFRSILFSWYSKHLRWHPLASPHVRPQLYKTTTHLFYSLSTVAQIYPYFRHLIREANRFSILLNAPKKS
jgi:hypothetical protein